MPTASSINSQNSKKTVKPLKFLRVGVMAGALATCLNIVYMILDRIYGRFSMPMYVNVITIPIVSFSASFIAALGYRILYKTIKNPKGIYRALLVGCFVLSMYFPFKTTYPDGVQKLKDYESFFWLIVPMHIITTGVLMFYIPEKMKRKRKIV